MMKQGYGVTTFIVRLQPNKDELSDPEVVHFYNQRGEASENRNPRSFAVISPSPDCPVGTFMPMQHG